LGTDFARARKEKAFELFVTGFPENGSPKAFGAAKRQSSIQAKGAS